MAHNKVFFNAGPGGNPTGIGDLITRCTQAKIPVFIAATDSMTGLYDLQQAAIGSGVPHVGVYRSTGYYDPVAGKHLVSSAPPPGAIHLDVPNYGKPPSQAAEEHWAAHKATFPPELNKGVVWVATANECRGYVGWGQRGSSEAYPSVTGYTGWADWMGAYSYHAAQMALRDGYKYAAFGWSTGEPEEGAWEQPWMLKYLKLCAQHPNRLGIALHEYSLSVSDIWAGDGRLVGRFEDIFDACDEQGVAWPKVFITEWGWTHDDAPAVGVAMAHVRECAAYYASYEEIVGAATWSLIAGWGGIAKKVQPLIAPVAEFTLNTRFPDPEPKPTPTPVPTPAHGQPREQYKRIYWVVPTGALENQKLELYRQAAVANVTVGPSYDDAGLGALDDKTAVLFGIASDREREFRDWYAQHYPGTKVEFRPLPGQAGTPVPQPAPGPAPFAFTHWPTDTRRVTQPFGANAAVYKKFGLPGHEGVDVAAATGTPIYAVAPGTVSQVHPDEKDGHNYGRFVRVRHADGYETTYAHLESIQVKEGDRVNGGQVLGFADSTGNSSGSHLHLTLKHDEAGASGPKHIGYPHKIIDPTPFLEALAGDTPVSEKYSYRGPQVRFTAAIHAPGSDWMWGLPQVTNMLRQLNMPVKFLSNGVSADYFKSFRKNGFELVRIFWQPDGKKTPLEAWMEVRDGVLAFYANGARKFELFNEPNLPQEGLGTVWADGDEFARWLREFIGYMAGHMPSAELYYPGLSPGVPWTNQFIFTNKAWPQIKTLCSGFCLHAYTGETSKVALAVDDIVTQVQQAQAYLRLDKPLIVSECSVNRPASPSFKAAVYRGVEKRLSAMPGIAGVVYFISHWDAPPEQASYQESWLDTGLAPVYLATK